MLLTKQKKLCLQPVRTAAPSISCPPERKAIPPLTTKGKKHLHVAAAKRVVSPSSATPVPVPAAGVIPSPIVHAAAPAVIPSNTIDWLEQNAPRTITGVIGREAQITRLDEWLQDFTDNPNPAKPMALLHGRPGTGKTSVSHLLLAKHGYQIVEINASDTRTYEGITKVLDRVCLRRSINGKAALLLDEIDGAFESDTGKSSISAIKDFLVTYKADQHKSPIIATCNVTHKANIKQLFPYALVVPFPKLYDNHLSQIAKQVSQRHSLHVDQQRISAIVKGADGDARQVIQSLRLLSLRGGATFAKDDGNNVFEIAKQLLRGKRLTVHLDVFVDCGGYGTGLLFQNYPNAIVPTKTVPVCFDNLDSLSMYADAFSDSDVLRNREEDIDSEIVLSATAAFGHSVLTRDISISTCHGSYFNRPLPRSDYWDDVFEQKVKKSGD